MVLWMLVYVVLEPKYRYKVVQYSYRIMGNLKVSTLYHQDDKLTRKMGEARST
jgi:hypothetical protein